MLATGRGDGAILIVLTATTAVVSRASRAPAVAQVLFVALLTVASYVMAFGGVGSAALDSAVAHFVLPAAAAPLLLGAALRSGVVAWPRSGRHGADLALILVAAGLTVAVGAAWELVEFALTRSSERTWRRVTTTRSATSPPMRLALGQAPRRPKAPWPRR
jgi:hypothetical protein